MSETPHKLDTTGTVCPLPILLTAKALLKLEVGDVLEVTGDDPAILDDMPVYCLRAGHRLLEMEEDDDEVIHCRIEKVNDD
jgi:tRNA 2-thiouridine synthesizing protein A